MASFFKQLNQRLGWLDDMLHADSPSRVLWAEMNVTAGGHSDSCHLSPAVYYHNIDELGGGDGDIEFEPREAAVLLAGGFFVVWRRKLRQLQRRIRKRLSEERQYNRTLWALAVGPVWVKVQRRQAEKALTRGIGREQLRLLPEELASCARGLGCFSSVNIQQCMTCLFRRLWSNFRVQYIKPSGDGMAADLRQLAACAKWQCWREVEAGIIVEMMLEADAAGMEGAKLTQAAEEFLNSCHWLMQEKLIR